MTSRRPRRPHGSTRAVGPSARPLPPSLIRGSGRVEVSVPRTRAIESHLEAPRAAGAPARCSPRKTSMLPDARLGHERAGHLVEFGGHGAHAPQLSAGEEDGVLGELTVELQQLDRSGLAQKAVQGYRWDEDRIGPVRLRAAGARPGLDPPALEPAPGSERQRAHRRSDRHTAFHSARIRPRRRYAAVFSMSNLKFSGSGSKHQTRAPRPRQRWRTRRCKRRRRGSGSRGDTCSRARSDSPRPPRGPTPHPKCRPAWRLSLAAFSRPGWRCGFSPHSRRAACFA